MVQGSFSKFTKSLVSASALLCVLLLAGCSKTGTIEVQNDSNAIVAVAAAMSDGSGEWQEVVNAGGKVSKDVDAGDWVVAAAGLDGGSGYKTVSVKKRKTVKLTYKNKQLN